MLDIHVWIWWVDGSPRLDALHRQAILDAQQDSIGVSVISCWEVAKLVELGKLKLAVAVDKWINDALALPDVQLVPLTPEIAIESTQLPQPFHRDPMDQILVATARVIGCPIMTLDQVILAYPHVKKIP